MGENLHLQRGSRPRRRDRCSRHTCPPPVPRLPARSARGSASRSSPGKSLCQPPLKRGFKVGIRTASPTSAALAISIASSSVSNLYSAAMGPVNARDESQQRGGRYEQCRLTESLLLADQARGHVGKDCVQARDVSSPHGKLEN